MIIVYRNKQVLALHVRRDNMDASATNRRQTLAAFHEDPSYHLAPEFLREYCDKSHSPFSLHKLQKGLYRAMGLRRRRHSSASELVTPLRQSRRLSSEVPPPVVLPHIDQCPHTDESDAQEIFQFRKLRLPSSDSYDGSAEKAAREFASCRPASSLETYPINVNVYR